MAFIDGIRFNGLLPFQKPKIESIEVSHHLMDVEPTAQAAAGLRYAALPQAVIGEHLDYDFIFFQTM